MTALQSGVTAPDHKTVTYEKEQSTMTREPPQCDVETLEKLEAYAPHWLTPADRYALRLHRAAPAVRRSVPAIVLAIGLALVVLPFLLGVTQ